MLFLNSAKVRLTFEFEISVPDTQTITDYILLAAGHPPNSSLTLDTFEISHQSHSIGTDNSTSFNAVLPAAFCPQLSGAVGGLFHGEIPLICGGRKARGALFEKRCHTLFPQEDFNDNVNFLTLPSLIHERWMASGVMIRDFSTLFVTGGFKRSAA